ncbi:hypothetical protein [Hymenobacter actinosclerus]|uniref:hypothetical protein n=1 Tax=Hymenobacter actinosclerus TaxID=82805 RepID=UPI0011604B83|nr:hypothetical protein [Hymenobacter actinosclerus]
MLAIGMISFFLGVGQGKGKAVATKNENGTLEYNSILTFNSNGPSEKIYLIGTNSANAFYFVRGNKNVKISPMLSIKTIELENKNSK